MPSYSGGAPVPFVPGVYQPDSTIAQMILQAGRQRADLQQRGAENLAGTVMQLGHIVSQIPGQIADEKARRARALLDTARAEQEQMAIGEQKRQMQQRDIAARAMGGNPTPGMIGPPTEAQQAAQGGMQNPTGSAVLDPAIISQRLAAAGADPETISKAIESAKKVMQTKLEYRQSFKDLLGQHAFEVLPLMGTPYEQGAIHTMLSSLQEEGLPQDQLAKVATAYQQNPAAFKDAIVMPAIMGSEKALKGYEGTYGKLTSVPEGGTIKAGVGFPGGGQTVAEGALKMKTPVAALDTTTGKMVFVTPEQIAAAPARFQPPKTGVNVNLGGGVSVPTGTVDAERPDPATANAIDRTTGLTGNALYQNAATYALTGHMPAMGMGGKGPVTAARMAIQNKAGAIAAKAGIDLPTLQAEYRANAGTLAKLLPQAQATANFANTAKDNLALALGQSPKVTRTDSAWINSVANAFVRGVTPAAPLTKFETYIFTAAREYAKVTTGGAMSAQALSDTATKEATKLLNASQSPEAFAAATQAMQDDMDNVIKRQTEGMARVSSTIANFFGAANNVPVGVPASPAPTHAAPAGPAPIIQRNTDTGEYRHSLDGGKTWKPGKP